MIRKIYLEPNCQTEIVKGQLFAIHNFNYLGLPCDSEEINVLKEGLTISSKDYLQQHPLLPTLDILVKEGLLSCQYFWSGDYSFSFQGFQRLDMIFSSEMADKDKEYEWSRFACIRRIASGWQIETPLTAMSIHFPTLPGLNILESLIVQPNRDADSDRQNIPQDYSELLRSVLLWMKVIHPVAENPEDSSDALRMWEFHDFYFHSRSRMGRHQNGVGGNYRFKGKIKALPAIKEKPKGQTIPLPVPNPFWYTNRDISFSQVVEYRQSQRLNGRGNLNIYQLSEFLYRSARMRTIDTSNPLMEVSNRPYPNGGACYELELYLTISRCTGLTHPGLYYYDSALHQLIFIREMDELVQKNLANATWSTGQNLSPPLLINIAARFQRVSWKYEGIAYALILKNTGVLYHQFYLMATAMGLNPCGVGIGNSDLFCEIAGTKYEEEGTVGELILNGSLS